MHGSFKAAAIAQARNNGCTLYGLRRSEATQGKNSKRRRRGRRWKRHGSGKRAGCGWIGYRPVRVRGVRAFLRAMRVSHRPAHPGRTKLLNLDIVPNVTVHLFRSRDQIAPQLVLLSNLHSPAAKHDSCSDLEYLFPVSLAPKLRHYRDRPNAQHHHTTQRWNWAAMQ